MTWYTIGVPTDGGLITLAEAARRLGVHRSLLHHYRKRGLLKMAWDANHIYHLVWADEVEALRPYLKKTRQATDSRPATPSSG